MSLVGLSGVAKYGPGEIIARPVAIDGGVFNHAIEWYSIVREERGREMGQRRGVSKV